MKKKLVAALNSWHTLQILYLGGAFKGRRFLSSLRVWRKGLRHTQAFVCTLPCVGLQSMVVQ